MSHTEVEIFSILNGKQHLLRFRLINAACRKSLRDYTLYVYHDRLSNIIIVSVFDQSELLSGRLTSP